MVKRILPGKMKFGMSIARLCVLSACVGVAWRGVRASICLSVCLSVCVSVCLCVCVCVNNTFVRSLASGVLEIRNN